MFLWAKELRDLAFVWHLNPFLGFCYSYVYKIGTTVCLKHFRHSLPATMFLKVCVWVCGCGWTCTQTVILRSRAGVFKTANLKARDCYCDYIRLQSLSANCKQELQQTDTREREKEEESGTDCKQKPRSGGNRISLSRPWKRQWGRKSNYQNRWAEAEQLTAAELCLRKQLEMWVLDRSLTYSPWLPSL